MAHDIQVIEGAVDTIKGPRSNITQNNEVIEVIDEYTQEVRGITQDMMKAKVVIANPVVRVTTWDAFGNASDYTIKRNKTGTGWEWKNGEKPTVDKVVEQAESAAEKIDWGDPSSWGRLR